MSLPQDTIFYKGDTLELQFQIFKNKTNNEYWNLTNYKIRFELQIDDSHIKKATENVTGGSDEQITILDALEGSFIINISASESKNLPVGDYNISIQIESEEGKKYTVVTDKIRILPAQIDWESIT
jgi:hypothetical protein